MQKRLDWIDIAKGLGIVLVVFAHTLVPQIRESSTGAKYIWIFIYNFHMPLFFFLSGYLFEKGLPKYTDESKFILGKLKYLMLPYLTFSVFAYVFINIALNIGPLASVLEGGGYSATGIKDAVLQILTYNGHIDQHLWFVYSLFFVFLINIIMPKVMKSKKVLILLLALYVSKAYVRYYGILDYITSDLVFFSLARVMYSESEKITFPPLKTLAVFVLFITTNCLYSYFYITEMPTGIIKGVLYTIRSISSVSGIMTVCTIAKYLQDKAVAKPLTSIGLYSYDIYLMHAPFLVSGLMGILLAYSPLPPIVCCGGVLVVGIALPYLLSRFIIRKIPLFSVLILGKNYKRTNGE